MNWEVRAMPSGTSLFSPVLFRKNLVRFAPLWAIFLILMLLAGPVSVLYNQAYGLSSYFSEYRFALILYSFFYAPLCAGLLFRYLHHTRSAYMLHAFPLNRSTQFVTNVISGLCFAFVPFLLQFGLNLLASVHMSEQIYLWRVLALEVLSFTFFFGLAVFCMHLSGNSIISVLSYFVLNFVFCAVPALFRGLLELVSFGFDLWRNERVLTALAPVVRMLSTEINEQTGIARADWTVFLIYGLLGCGLLAVSWLLYRARHLEQAGEAMVFRWARYAFVAVFTVFCTLGVGLLLTELFATPVGSWRETLPPLLAFFLLASFLGWFGAQMMLGRTVRVFKKKQVLGWLGIAAATVALICGLRFDVLGTQRHVPAQAELAGATLILDTNNYAGRSNLQAELDVNDPEVLSAVTEAHRDAYAAFLAEGRQYGYDMTVHYHLRSGRTVTRVIPIDSAPAAKLNALLNKPEYATQYYKAILPKAFEQKNYFELYRIIRDDKTDQLLRVCSDRDALQTAILQDAAEGKLPIPIFYMDDDFNWQLTAFVTRENYSNSANLWLPVTAKHTLNMFAIEP